MGRLLLANARILDPEADGALEPGSLLLENGRIAARVKAGERIGPVEVMDVSGAILAPGFLDLHVHGSLVFGSHDAVHDALGRLAASCVRHGTTGFLPTTIAWERERLAPFVAALASATSAWSGRGAIPLGLHLEGPWIQPSAAGAHPRSGIRPYDAAEGRDLLDRAEGAIRMVTLAPETAGSRELLRELARRGVVAAAGHSHAGRAELDGAISGGLTHVTHLFNAMPVMHHREPGLAGHALADDRLTCDLICDGEHVHPEFVRVAARAKRERLILISDRIDPPPDPAAADFGSGPVREDGAALRLPDGTLAGSRLTLDRAIRNARSFGALALAEAVAACTSRPARLLGIERERGTLRPGARADLVVLDDQGGVRETWIGGERVYASARGIS